MSARRIFITLSLTIAFIAPVASLRYGDNGASASFSVHAASHDPVRATHGMVASTSRIASEVGRDVMRRGGNAVDAAIATAFALAVTYPAAGNLGGGGFMMIRLKSGATTAIDYREMAPQAATRNIYQDKNGNLIKGEGSSTVGYRAAGVPGTVAGMELALKKYGSGKLTWVQLIEPARKLAADGFPLTHALNRGFSSEQKLLNSYEDSRRIFLNNGKLYNDGDTLRQTELAQTFARLQRNGAREFYEGETARLIVADMKRHNGLMTLEDLKNYVAQERVPLRAT